MSTLDTSVRTVTAFTSFAQLEGAMRAHGYVPTLLHCGTRRERERDAIRAELATELRTRGYRVFT